MPIERKKVMLDDGGITIEEIYTASSPQSYAVIENGVVVNNIVVDADEYTPEQVQDLFGSGNLCCLLPEAYGIGDFYDAATGEWTKAPMPADLPECDDNNLRIERR